MATSPTPTVAPTPDEVSAEVSSLLDRVTSAVSEVTAAVRSLKPQVQEYFAEQLERSRAVVDDLTKASVNARDSLKDVPVSEIPVVLALEATSRGRAAVAELSARASRYDEENKVSATVSAVVEGARSRTIAVFADASVRLHALKANLKSSAAALASRVSPTSGESTDSSTPAGDVPLPASPRDVRTTVTDLMAALEDIVHHASEHERIVQARTAAASVSARAAESASAARSRASELLTAASGRASDVAGELRVTLGRISSLPPLTLKELRALVSDAQVAAGSAVASASSTIAAATAATSDDSTSSSPTPAPTAPSAEEHEWASSITRSLVDVLGRANESLQQVKEAVLAASEEDEEEHAEGTKGTDEDEDEDDAASAGAGAGSGSSDAKAVDASAPPPATPSQARRLVIGSIRLARRHASEVVERTQKALAHRQERLTGAAKGAASSAVEKVGTLAASVDKRLGVVDGVAGMAVSVDRKLGVTETATSVATRLDSRFSLTERYASALSMLQGVDQRWTGGRGASAVATGQALAAPTVSYVKERYTAAATDAAAAVNPDATDEVAAEVEA